MGTMDLAMTMVKFLSRVLFMMIKNKKKEKKKKIKMTEASVSVCLLLAKGPEGH